ncbi:outer membrane beta-barrel protein [uncultured Chitinophaga sp.]|uniref:outer membrane beta-barrel protein n=1 Tax=uncultured Chitinophaga sp. TaxID=339340 RepID=UPI0026382BFE|nr:outer membrane beta-barrel protein [uncultured Chitinophaga sp.]
MQKILVLLTSIFITFSVSAQPPAGAPGAAKRQAAPSIGHIFGKAIDSTGKGLRDATVVILQSQKDSVTGKMKDKLLKGTTTQANGDFSLEDLPVAGPLKINISAIGYAPHQQTVSFFSKPPAGQPAGPPNFDKDLGRIQMKPDVRQLAGVTITSSAPALRMEIDKKVFNVTQNIVSAGGTAVNVMKNVPSVNVDIDGNVTLRNASPQIYIDGRPTTLTLDQIPADAIESVEVITNPSAKYDASGGNAGILNIVLKKNKKSGYNGNINAGVDKRGGVNGGVSFNVRQDKINFSLSGFGNQMRNRNSGSTDIRSGLSDPALLVSQRSNTRMNGGFLFGRVGVDYFVTNRTTLSIGALKVHGSFDPKDVLRADSAYENSNYISYSERNTRNKREFNANGLQGGFKYLFPKQGEELTADVNYFSGKGDNNAYYNTDVFTAAEGAKTGNTQQRILGEGSTRFLTMQTDYVKPLKGSSKLEAGLRAQLRKMSNNQDNYYLNPATGDYQLVPSNTSNYKNKDNVYAAYLSFTSAIKDFGYKVGLRAERSDYTGELIDTKQEFVNNYPISLFPSVFLSQKLKNKQEVQLSYTRRINRPFFLQLIPFIDSTDQLNWTRGNAGLKPEFTNSVEASWSKTFSGNNTLMASVYYKYATDLITRYLDTVTTPSGSKHPISTYVNANSSRSIGAEITSQNTLTKWWDMNTNVNVYNSRINADNVAGASQDALWSWFAKMNNTFKLPASFKVQLSGTYQSKTNLPVNQGNNGPGGGGPFGGGAQSAAQGYIKSYYGVDIALQKSFLKNNAASVTLSVNDIFRTRRFDQYTESNFYTQFSHRIGDVPMFRLNFAYRFGQMDMSLFKRKNTKGEAEGAQGAMQGLQ